MYIWNFELETHWTFEEEGDEPSEDDYVVSGNSFEQAFEKAKKLALAKTRTFEDDTDPKKKYSPISTELVKVERGDWIDA